MMTDEQLDEIERRADAANVVEVWGASGVAVVNGGIVARVWREPDRQLWLHAKSDILALVAEVRRMREELDGCRAQARAVNEALNRGDGAYRP